MAEIDRLRALNAELEAHVKRLRHAYDWAMPEIDRLNGVLCDLRHGDRCTSISD